MSRLDIEITGNSVMESNVLAIAAAYDALTVTSKVVTENNERPKWLFGRVALNRNIGPPRVTWVPTSGPIEPPQNMGGGLANGATVQRDRSLADRLLGFQVYCNGRSYEEAENLMVSVIAATRAALGVGTTFGTETWLTEQVDVADQALNKFEVMLDVNIRIPVIDEQAGLTVVTTQTHTEDIDNTLPC